MGAEPVTAKVSYESAEALLHDPVPANCETSRAALHTLGFRKIETVGTIDAFSERLRDRTADLVLCELAGAETELCKLIQSLRQGVTGTNPFAVVVMTTWRREAALVNQVINAGADDLIARPYSLSLLGDRVRQHVEQRRGFVVTCDYVGPDRRRDPRPEEKNALMDVPNSLRMRAMNSRPQADTDRAVADAVAVAKVAVGAEKMRRDAFQLCLQWRLIEQRQPAPRDLSDMLERMAELAGEVKHRAAGTQHELAAKWCESVVDCTEAISTMLQFSHEDDESHAPTLAPMMHLLGHAALTLGHMFQSNASEHDLLVELDTVAARLDVRRSLPSQAVN